MNKLYNKEYEEERLNRESERGIMYKQEFERIKKIVNIKMKGKVLDVGCGEGEFLLQFGNKWDKFGTEINENLINICSQKGIKMNQKLNKESFDIIIFRGTIQHLPNPFEWINKSYKLLKKNGYIIFLATPNTDSLYYSLWKDLPMIKEDLNYLLPSERILRQTLNNIGFKNIKFFFPYWETPYKSNWDFVNFVLKCFGLNTKFAFPRNTMECYARK